MRTTGFLPLRLPLINSIHPTTNSITATAPSPPNAHTGNPEPSPPSRPPFACVSSLCVSVCVSVVVAAFSWTVRDATNSSRSVDSLRACDNCMDVMTHTNAHTHTHAHMNTHAETQTYRTDGDVCTVLFRGRMCGHSTWTLVHVLRSPSCMCVCVCVYVCVCHMTHLSL